MNLSVLYPPKTLYGDQTWPCRRWCNSTSWSCYWSPWEMFCCMLCQMDLKYHQIPTAQFDVFCTTVMNRRMFIGQEIRTDWSAGAQAGFERIRQDNFSLGSDMSFQITRRKQRGDLKALCRKWPFRQAQWLKESQPMSWNLSSRQIATGSCK